MSLLPLKAASSSCRTACSTSSDANLFRQRSFSLYRKYLRQVNRLPFAYLRYFFQFKAQDDIRALLATKEHGRRPHLRERKFKRLSKEVKKLEAANNSESVDAWTHILSLAYGRKGKLKQELMEPHLTDPTQPLPKPIIPAVPKSHPPVYSEILKSLLTNSLSRSTTPSTKNNYNVPLKLPDRTSPEAIIVNAPWKRREVNARWRHFVESTNNTYYPLGINNEGPRTLLNSGVLDDMHNIVGPVDKINPLTRKERQALERQGKPIPAQIVDRYPSRWVRRRFQKVLAHVPILSQNGRRYQVSISKVAITKHDTSGNRLPQIDEVSDAWITHKSSSRPSR